MSGETEIWMLPESGQGSYRGEIIAREEFSGGGLDYKERVTIRLEGGKEVRMVLRENTGAYIRGWRLLEGAGLPVVRTVRRVIEDGKYTNKVLLSDLTANGSALYGKSSLLRANNDENEPSVSSHPLDEVFLQLTEEASFSEIEKEARRLAERATENSVVLPCDDGFELWVHPYETWELITLDTIWAQNDRGGKPRRCEELNGQIVDMFLDDLKDLREEIKSIRNST